MYTHTHAKTYKIVVWAQGGGQVHSESCGLVLLHAFEGLRQRVLKRVLIGCLGLQGFVCLWPLSLGLLVESPETGRGLGGLGL